LIYQGDYLSLIKFDTELNDAVSEMSRCGFGCVGILDKNELLIGIFTDGDLRRCMHDVKMSTNISDIMNKSPLTISSDAFAEDVAYLFTKKRIPSIFIVEKNKPVGIVHIHDLLQRGLL
jgi:arabinose-5-phosphate isomerase